MGLRPHSSQARLLYTGPGRRTRYIKREVAGRRTRKKYLVSYGIILYTKPKPHLWGQLPKMGNNIRRIKMLDTMAIKQARKLASAVCEARAIAEELSQDLHLDSMEHKNQHVADAFEELAEQIAEWAEDLAQIESQADDLIQPYDREIA